MIPTHLLISVLLVSLLAPADVSSSTLPTRDHRLQLGCDSSIAAEHATKKWLRSSDGQKQLIIIYDKCQEA